jgi:ADP-heptose:LPS heptosyltransferase
MGVLAAIWKSFQHEFFPTARRSKLHRTHVERAQPLGKSLPARLYGLARLWANWILRRAWIHCDHPPFDPFPNKELPKFGGVIEIQGWAVSVDGIESVTVSCDGSDVGTAPVYVRRPQLARFFPHIHRVARNGFYLPLDTRALADGCHEVTLTARTRNGRIVRISGPMWVNNNLSSYDRWRLHTAPNVAAIAWMRRNTPHLGFRPVVSLLLPVRTEEALAALPRTLETVGRQAYPHWQVVIACSEELQSAVARVVGRQPDDRFRLVEGDFTSDASARSAALRESAGELFAPLDAGDRLEPEALFEVVYACNRMPEAGLVYGDEEVAGRPVFKPDWSPQMLLAVNYVGRFWAARRALLRDDEGFDETHDSAAEYDLLLRLTERASGVAHVPAVLVRRAEARPVPESEDACDAVRSALRRRGADAAVTPGPVARTIRVRRSLQGRPLVTILVEGTAAAAHQLLDSLALRTSYRDHELRLVGKAGPGLAERLNKTVDAARGDYILFVRASAVLSEDWVEALLELAACPEVGAVGGHLVDVAGRIVDAGLIPGADDRLLIPVAQSREADDPGTLPYLGVSRECSAVSRDCLMVRRELFQELGGFDERLDGELVAADFCLHARSKGYAVISTPFARLRGVAGDRPQPSLAAVEVYRSRWGTVHERGDPFFSPNFSRRRDGFRLNDEPTTFNLAPSPRIDRESVRRILAVKPDHVGDLLLALPAVRRLRELFPEAELTMLVGPHNRALLEREPGIDRVLTYEIFYGDSHRPPRKLTAADRAEVRAWLAGYNFDLAVDLRREDEARELVRLSGARWTAGFAEPGDSEWLTVRLPCEGAIKLLKPGRHMTQDLLRLVDMVARSMDGPSLLPAPPPTAEDAEVNRLIDAAHASGQPLLIGIHPGSGRRIKCWSPAYFGRLAGMFTERLGAAVVVFGGPGEEQLAAELIRNAPPGAPIVSLAGRFGLTALTTAVRRCDLFVGNDSGPTHLAATTGIPVLAVFAGTADPQQWGPVGPNAASIQLALACAPCYTSRPRDCPIRVACTRYLHPEPVFEAAVRMLLPRWEKLPSFGKGCMERIARATAGNR